MNTFHLRIYSADNIYFDGECEHLMIPTEDGQYGILAFHRNTISEVLPGILNFRPKGQDNKQAIVTRGMVKIEDNDVLVLVHRCEDPEMVDINAVKRAELELARQFRERKSMEEYKQAEANLSRAFSNLNKKNKDLKF